MTALVLGATGGIGAAVVEILAARGPVLSLSRSDGLDWMHADRAESALQLAAEKGPFEMIFDATGALIIDGQGPEKQLKAIDAAALARQMQVNAIGPALMFKHYQALLPRQGRAVMATISARVGSIGDNGLGGWIGYRAAKAALNQIVRTASIEIARTRREAIVAALHPGTVATGLSDPFAGQRDRFSTEHSATQMLAVLDGLSPQDTGHLFAYDGSRIPW